MKLSGTHTLNGSKQEVWDALQDPRVLVETLPGCHQLEETGPNTYTATVEAGIASIKGVYDGHVELTEQDEPNGYTLKASGSGGPGTIDATARVTLNEANEGQTELTYDADAVVGGAIAGVGQRVLGSAAKRQAADFFSAVDEVLTGERSLDGEAEAVEEDERPPEGVPREEEADRTARRTVRRRAEPARGAATQDPRWLLAAGLCGALVALLGVLVGQRRR